jgi:hypothetical protein
MPVTTKTKAILASRFRAFAVDFQALGDGDFWPGFFYSLWARDWIQSSIFFNRSETFLRGF